MKKLWNDVVAYFDDNIWNIIGFFSLLIIGLIVVKTILSVFKKLLGKTKMEKITQHFLLAIIKLGLYLVLTLALLSKAGVQITGILTTLSALVLAVGMALQNNISNVANGIVMVSTHMFKKGDYIAVDGVEGSIAEINFLFTTLTTSDNKKITIPNSTIVNSTVVNSGANDKRRVGFTFSVAYESDIELVKEIVTEVMASNGKVYLDPAPFCRLKTLNASSLDFACNCWCDTGDYWSVYYDVTEMVYNEFKRNNISVPYNQLEVRERKDEVVMPVIGEGIPQRVEKERGVKKSSHFNVGKIIKHKSKIEKETVKN